MGLVVRSKVEDVKAAELARRVKTRAPELHCSACGNQDFAILEVPSAKSRTMLWRHHTDGQIEDTIASQYLVSLLCTRCGHVEQFAEAILNGAVPTEYGEPVDNG